MCDNVQAMFNGHRILLTYIVVFISIPPLAFASAISHGDAKLQSTTLPWLLIPKSLAMHQLLKTPATFLIRVNESWKAD